jgi:hypothetical protein
LIDERGKMGWNIVANSIPSFVLLYTSSEYPVVRPLSGPLIRTYLATGYIALSRAIMASD